MVQRVKEKALSKTKKGPRGGKMYKCIKCKGYFGSNKVNVDHKKPIIGLKEHIDNVDYNTLVERIFCSPRNLQVLCLDCHKIKSKEENKKRREWRKQNLNTTTK